MSRSLKWLAAIALLPGIMGLVVWLSSAAARTAAPATAFLALSRVPVPEMPATAADLVESAAPLERGNTAKEVMQAVGTMARPGTMPFVVSAICRRNPEVTGTAVTTAIQLQPDDVLYICRAAVCAAPDQVEQIVASACAIQPGSFANVALVAFDRCPAASPLILYGVTNTLPGLQTFCEQAAQPGGTNDFVTLIKQTVKLVNEAGKAKIENRK